MEDDTIYEKIAGLEPIKEYMKKIENEENKAQDQMVDLPSDTQASNLYKMLGKREDELLEGFENMLELNDDNSDGENEGTHLDNVKRVEFDPKDVGFFVKLVSLWFDSMR